MFRLVNTVAKHATNNSSNLIRYINGRTFTNCANMIRSTTPQLSELMSSLHSKMITPYIDPTSHTRTPVLDNPLNRVVKIGTIVPSHKKIEEISNKCEITDPSVPGGEDKYAFNILIIRRKKMKKHKLKKLRKRMKFVFARRRRRRLDRKEKAFKEEIMHQLKEVSKFDPADHVAKQLEMANREIPLLRWRGVRLPLDVINDCLQQAKEKRLRKLDTVKRREEMLKERGTLEFTVDKNKL